MRTQQVTRPLDYPIYQYVREFLQYLDGERHYSAHTIQAYATDLHQLLAYFKETQVNELQAVTRETLRTFMEFLLDRGMTITSVVRKIAAVRSFFKYCAKKNIIDGNPAAILLVPKVPKQLPHYLDEGTTVKVLEAPDGATAQGKRDRAILELFYSTGIRLGELVQLNAGDIDFYNSSVKVLGKGSKQRVIPIGKQAIDALKTSLATRAMGGRMSAEHLKQPLFISNRGTRLSREMITVLVRKYIDAAAESEKKSPHLFRHTFATHLLDRGADLVAVKELLGHESLSTTQVYTHVSTEQLKKVYRQSHPKA